MQQIISFARKYVAILTAILALVISVLAMWTALIGKTLDVSGFLGTLPQWITAVIAGGALSAAWVSIRTQREIARKRATVDFFLKTEMDSHLLTAHKNYLKGIEALEIHLAAGKTLAAFTETEACSHIRDYLNVHELLAVGIHQDVLDDNVSFNFWHRELMRACSKTANLIAHIQTQPGNQKTYVDLVALCQRWEARLTGGG
ncbi:MAG TPA: DUF4760 domain-containing protein [Terriglobales bacterium]|nr:DUF4760 domain-containing protein [Terriglobales bacterium]